MVVLGGGAVSYARGTPVERLRGGEALFTEMCSGSEAGSYLRLIDFVYHSPLGLRVTKQKREERQ